MPRMIDASNAAGSGAINDGALMADILKSCLAEIGVACYVARPESGPIAVRVLPEDEDRDPRRVRPPSHRRRPSPVAKCPPRQIISFAHLASASAAGHATNLALAVALWGDNRVTQFIGGPFSPEQIEHRLKKRKRLAARASLSVLASVSALQTASTSVAPVCVRINWKRKFDELGFHLRPEFWGQCFAKEAARAVIAYAFETLRAKALSAGHHPANASSRHILEKLGFHFTHEEFYAPCGLQISYYLLARPSI